MGTDEKIEIGNQALTRTRGEWGGRQVGRDGEGVFFLFRHDIGNHFLLVV
jgi:hypothetical protein